MNRIKQAGSTATRAVLALLIATVGIASVGGWIANIVTLCHSAAPFHPVVIVRIAGIFIVPLGCVMGYIG